MRSDRTTKVLLALIASGLWALTIVQIGAPISTAHAVIEPPSTAQQQVVAGSASSPKSAAPASRIDGPTLPLRWRVRHVSLYENATLDCIPVISVSNFGPATVDVEVEWIDSFSSARDLSSDTVVAGGARTWILHETGASTWAGPFTTTNWCAASGSFYGIAQVHSNDPRIAVAAFLRCDSSPADQIPISINSLPADPVGATAEYFQAGMPATWTTPMAVPELPE